MAAGGQAGLWPWPCRSGASTWRSSSFASAWLIAAVAGSADGARTGRRPVPAGRFPARARVVVAGVVAAVALAFVLQLELRGCERGEPPANPDKMVKVTVE